jgi:hypothetical protein
MSKEAIARRHQHDRDTLAACKLFRGRASALPIA